MPWQVYREPLTTEQSTAWLSGVLYKVMVAFIQALCFSEGHEVARSPQSDVLLREFQETMEGLLVGMRSGL